MVMEALGIAAGSVQPVVEAAVEYWWRWQRVAVVAIAFATGVVLEAVVVVLVAAVVVAAVEW